MDDKLAILRAKKVGMLIRLAREKAEKQVDECALWLDLDRNDYEKIEAGELAPSLPQLESLAAYLETDLKLLLQGPAAGTAAGPQISREMNLNLVRLRNHDRVCLCHSFQPHCSQQCLGWALFLSDPDFALERMETRKFLPLGTGRAVPGAQPLLLRNEQTAALAFFSLGSNPNAFESAEAKTESFRRSFSASGFFDSLLSTAALLRDSS